MTLTVMDPYTHEAHAVRCGQAARDRQVLQQHVVARKGKIVYCAIIRAPWTTPDGKDCWTLETSWPERTRITVPVRNVAVCGGPNCSCDDGFAGAHGACVPADSAASEAPPESAGAQAFPDPALSQAGVVAPPDGLNSEKTQVSAGT
jgi:hypothetical protein